MRRSCFILCFEILTTCPHRGDIHYPEIFINGYGIAVQAICPIVSELHLGKYTPSNTPLQILEGNWHKLAYDHYEKSVKPRKDHIERIFGEMTPFIDSHSMDDMKTLADMCETLRHLDAAYYAASVSWHHSYLEWF
jgi:hypothetical protein